MEAQEKKATWRDCLSSSCNFWSHSAATPQGESQGLKRKGQNSFLLPTDLLPGIQIAQI